MCTYHMHTLTHKPTPATHTQTYVSLSSIHVQVEHVDRTPPGLATKRSPSTVVELEGGRHGIFITSRHLQASDPDSPTQELEFTITRPPHFGYLENALTGRSQENCGTGIYIRIKKN